VKRSTEVKKLDAAVSRYVRKSNADANGNCACFTCGKSGSWKYEMDCGHFQTRSKYSTRWLYKPEDGLVNMMPQCKHCNLTNGGQQYAYGKRLDAVYGEGTADRIVRLSNTMQKFTTKEIVEMRKEWDRRFPE